MAARLLENKTTKQNTHTHPTPPPKPGIAVVMKCVLHNPKRLTDTTASHLLGHSIEKGELLWHRYTSKKLDRQEQHRFTIILYGMGLKSFQHDGCHQAPVWSLPSGIKEPFLQVITNLVSSHMVKKQDSQGGGFGLLLFWVGVGFLGGGNVCLFVCFW